MLLQLILEACPLVLLKWYGSAAHSWSVSRCLDLGIGGILGVWPWFYPTIQLDRPMLLLLLLPGKWLQFEKKTDYCLEILVPDREMWLGWPMEAKGWWNRPGGRLFTYFRHISSRLEPAGTGGCDEELGIAVFGWPSNSDSAWSASRRMIVWNIQNMFINNFWNRTCINRESALDFLWAEGECCTWWNQKEIIPDSGSRENLNTCWVSRVTPEWWVMEEEVCSEDFLLLQIGVQEYLDCEAKIWLAFR